MVLSDGYYNDPEKVEEWINTFSLPCPRLLRTTHFKESTLRFCSHLRDLLNDVQVKQNFIRIST